MLAQQGETSTMTADCYHCNGQGLIVDDAVGAWGEHTQYEYECGYCKGMGFIEWEKSTYELLEGSTKIVAFPAETKEFHTIGKVKKMSIYQKILEAQKKIGYVAKNGTNTFHKYQYATEADILDAVKKAYNEAGLVVTTSTTSELGSFEPLQKIDYNGNTVTEIVRWAKVTLSFKVIDAESGESECGTFEGYAEDKGDKAIYKATTGANKYFLMKFFGVATGDDPENESEQGGGGHTPTHQGNNKPAPINGKRNNQVVAAGVDPKTAVKCGQLAREILKFINSRALTEEEVRIYGKIANIQAARDLGDVTALEAALAGCQAQVQKMKEAI